MTPNSCSLLTADDVRLHFGLRSQLLQPRLMAPFSLVLSRQQCQLNNLLGHYDTFLSRYFESSLAPRSQKQPSYSVHQALVRVETHISLRNPDSMPAAKAFWTGYCNMRVKFPNNRVKHEEISHGADIIC